MGFSGWPKDWFVVVEKLDRLATGATSTTWATATFQAMEEIYNVDDCFSSDLEDGKRVSELCKETLGVETDEEEHWWETWDWRWEAFFHEWLVICPYVLPLSLILDLISSSRRSFEELTHPLSFLLCCSLVCVVFMPDPEACRNKMNSPGPLQQGAIRARLSTCIWQCFELNSIETPPRSTRTLTHCRYNCRKVRKHGKDNQIPKAEVRLSCPLTLQDSALEQACVLWTSG